MTRRCDRARALQPLLCASAAGAATSDALSRLRQRRAAFELTKLEDEQFEAQLAEGPINPEMQRKNVSGKAERRAMMAAFAVLVLAVRLVSTAA